jgi:SPP1 family predicted phage head-tail adaptor
VELQEDTRTATPGTRGEVAESWTTRAKVWANIEQLNANETLAFNQQYASASHRITTRWHSQVNPTPAWRIKATLNGKARYFHIASVENFRELNEHWVFICGEQVPVRDGDR